PFGADDRYNTGFPCPGPKYFNERNLQPLEKNTPPHTPNFPADILPVRHRTGERNQLVIVENRQGKNQVIEMTAHGVTIIGEQDVARFDVFLAPESDLGLDRIGEAADEHWQPQADGNRVAVGVDKSDGECLGFVYNRVVRRAHQIGLHLSGDRHDGTPNHFGGKGVDTIHAKPPVLSLLRLERVELFERFERPAFKLFQSFNTFKTPDSIIECRLTS